MNERMKEKIEYGEFCKVYGKTLRNRFLEYLLEMRDMEFAVTDVAEDIGISKPKAYDILKSLEGEDIVKKTRIVGGTQLYTLNKENKKVKLLIKNFKECLALVVEEYKPNKRQNAIEANVYVNDKCVNAMLAEEGR
jgi:DNA-binding MarR family transcriptional regulator